MDFHSLARRELQALCKKNKIPANITNVAMADALKALETVEGIEEYLKPMELETAQSSIDSPVKSEERSPRVLSTVGRSTRRRNVVREEPETLPSRTTPWRSTRKAVVGDEGEKGVTIETPALAATTRRRAQVSVVRRKVETQFEEEIGKEKKTVPPTPAPLGTTSRRKVKEEMSTVKKVYSTRRSVRLAEKSVEILKSNDEEKLETLKQELFTKEIGDNLDVSLKHGSDDSDKVLDIGGVDTKAMAQDNSESEKISEVEDPKFSLEGIKNMENQLELINEIQENNDDEISCDTDSQNATEKEIENAEDMELEVSLDVLVDENSCDIDSEKKSEKELKDEMDSEVFSHYLSNETKSELNVVDLVTPAADIVGEGSGIDMVKDVEMGLASNDSEADFELTDNGEDLDSPEILQHEQSEQDADQVSLSSVESLGEVSSDKVEPNFDFIDDSTFPRQIGERSESIEILESEQSKQESDQVVSDIPLSTLIPTADPTEEVQSTSLTPTKTPIKKSLSKKTPKTMKKVPDVLDNKENIGSGSKFFIFTQEKVKTPIKTPTTNKKMTDATDNKENLSGKKLILLTKEKVKKTGTTTEQNLHELSLRKLTKMFKEKLQITNQSSKNENDPKEATLRPALQALPENQLVDEAQN
ncbi:unnamed protein product [Fraxinus pennsylvanica]|uniref:Uncharacterized protein n=1 Tax=Fraxinus pennsylvanica TaxID=56036 RepID=A0AAD1ZLL3_9LAMI|nr:unnamed protein product [Fraxinus pennsylvanica]